MAYKHSCVVDTNAIYKTLVLVLLVENEEHQQEDQIQHYEMLEGEMLVDAVPPTMRPYAGAAGFIRPKWDADTSVWTEAANEEEIAAWEAERPATELSERELTAEERLTALEGAMLSMMGVNIDA